jgi:CBS domain-containing protein
MEVIRDLRRFFPTVMDKFYERSKEFRLVNDIMSQDVVTTTPDITMDVVAKTMGEMHIGSLIVLVDDEPIGIITERDLLSHVLAQGIDPKKIKVERVMSSPLISINPLATIKEAAQTMIKMKGRLAVLESGVLVGIITASDLIKSMPQVTETIIWVNKYMTKDVVMKDGATLVSSIVNIMGKKRIGSVVITSEGEPVGIFTERDLVSTFLAKGKSLDIQVGEACSKPLIAIPSRTTVNDAAFIMTSKHIKRLPIVEDQDLIGIITARDLVEAYAQ